MSHKTRPVPCYLLDQMTAQAAVVREAQTAWDTALAALDVLDSRDQPEAFARCLDLVEASQSQYHAELVALGRAGLSVVEHLEADRDAIPHLASPAA